MLELQPLINKYFITLTVHHKAGSIIQETGNCIYCTIYAEVETS